MVGNNAYIASIEQGRRFPPKDLVEWCEEVLDSGREG